MFCDHAYDYPPEDLRRDAQGRVLCPKCRDRCPECRKWFMKKEGDGVLCPDCRSDNMKRVQEQEKKHREKERSE